MVVRGAQANDATGGCNTTTTVAGAQRYFVRVIDVRTIQLTSTRAAALATSDATVTVTPGTPATAGDPTPLAVSSAAGLAVGTQVIYRAPVNTSSTFLGSQVNVSVVTEDDRGPVDHHPSTTHDETLENVFVGSDVYGALNNGDAVRYRSSGPSFGLTNDTTYYVIKSGDGYTVRFAASFCLAVGDDGSAACDGVTQTAVNLTVGTANGVEHNIARSLGGLIDGQTYYVASITGSTITLGGHGRRPRPRPRRRQPPRRPPHRHRGDRPRRADVLTRRVDDPGAVRQHHVELRGELRPARGAIGPAAQHGRPGRR